MNESKDSRPPVEERNSTAECNSTADDKTLQDTTTSPSSGTNNFTCSYCKKVYATRAGLYKHKRTYHPQKTTMTISCSEQGCKCVFRTLQQYRNHLQVFHSIHMEIFTKTFSNHQGMQSSYCI